MKNIEVVRKFYRQEIAHSSNRNLYTRWANNFGKNRIELINYDTVIAFIDIDTNEVHINISKYSSTTSTIQTMILDMGTEYYAVYKFRLYKGD